MSKMGTTNKTIYSTLIIIQNLSLCHLGKSEALIGINSMLEPNSNDHGHSSMCEIDSDTQIYVTMEVTFL